MGKMAMFTLIGSVLIASLSGAAEGPKTEPSAAAVAALTFASAMDSGDAAAAKAAALGGEKEMSLLDAMSAMTRCHRRLVSAAVVKFGDPGRQLGGSYASVGFEAVVRRAAITVDGDVALVREKPGVIFLRLKKSPDGPWKVDIAGSLPSDASQAIPLLERASRIADKTADEVETGLYRSLAEVKGAMAERGYPQERPDGTDKRVPTTKPRNRDVRGQNE